MLVTWTPRTESSSKVEDEVVVVAYTLMALASIGIKSSRMGAEGGGEVASMVVKGSSSKTIKGSRAEAEGGEVASRVVKGSAAETIKGLAAESRSCLGGTSLRR